MNILEDQDQKPPNPPKDIKISPSNLELTNTCAMKIPKSCMESEKDNLDEPQKMEKFLCESDDEMSGFSSNESDDESGNNGGEFWCLEFVEILGL